MIKTLTSTAILAAIGSIGLASAASAAIFQNGSTFSVTFSGVQFNIAGANTPPSVSTPVFGTFPFPPTNEPNGQAQVSPNGGTNGALDVLFAPVNTNFVSTSSNLIIDGAFTSFAQALANPSGAGGTAGDAAINNWGQFTIGSRTGNFNNAVDPVNGVAPGTVGAVRNADGPTIASDFFFVLPTANGSSARYFLTITDAPIFRYNDGVTQIGVGGPPTSPGFFESRFSGTITYVNGSVTESALFSGDFSGQFVSDLGTLGDAVARDGITNLPSQSATFTISVIPVPEPSTLGLLGATLLIGASSRMIRKKK